MKTPHLAIIIVTILISGLFISSYLPTASSTCIFGANGKPTSCNTGPYTMTSYPPPLQQVRHGIPSNQVKCNQGFQLVIKSEDGSSFCVKPDTANILRERGWAEPVTSGISIPARYGLSNARNSTTVLGYHVLPQAGLTIFHDKIKLLVSK